MHFFFFVFFCFLFLFLVFVVFCCCFHPRFCFVLFFTFYFDVTKVTLVLLLELEKLCFAHRPGKFSFLSPISISFHFLFLAFLSAGGPLMMCSIPKKERVNYPVFPLHNCNWSFDHYISLNVLRCRAECP